MNEQQELHEVNEEDFNEEILKRKVQIKKRTNIVFVSVLIVFITRFFGKYIDFNVVLNSTVLVTLFALTFLYAIVSRIYCEGVKIYAKDFTTNNTLKRFNDFLDLLIVIPIFVTIITVLNVTFLSISNVEGTSMEPNYYDQDDIIIYHSPFMEYERLDVVILQVDSGDYYIKRIIGLPGETVQIDNDTILIDDVALDQTSLNIEEYTYCNVSYGDNCEFVVPDGTYFVLGDNRTSSYDSRNINVGYVEEETLFGRVIYKYKNIFRRQEE